MIEIDLKLRDQTALFTCRLGGIGTSIHFIILLRDKQF